MCRKVVRVSRKVLHSLQQIARDTAICEVSSLAIQTAIILINIKRVQDALKSKE
jgi:hypothetical protein